MPSLLSLRAARTATTGVVAVATGWSRGAVAAAGPWPARARAALRLVSGLGWTVLGVAIVSWLIGRWLGWQELMLIATAALVLFAACAVLTAGRTRLQVRIHVDPLRVVVGSASAGTVTVANRARSVLLPVVLELPVGRGAARFSLPALRRDVEHEELFVVPTDRRGVVPIGPAMTVRGDPLGLMRRAVSWTGVLELFVHPRTVPLDSVGAGLLRDLEGQTTNDVSMSDLAFHALRDYEPGDDRRYIHWRSSAKAGRFLIRQFLDTRRTHVTAVVDSDPAAYSDPEDYETAISVAASVAVRIQLDEQELTVVAGAHATQGEAGPRILDVFSRAELNGDGLPALARRAALITNDTSAALLVTGANVGFDQLHRAAAHFGPEVRVIVIRVDAGRPTGIAAARGMTVLNLQKLTELPALLAGALG